jgi:hypothetical protein
VRLEQFAEEMLTAEPHTLATQTGRVLAVYDLSDMPGVYLGGKVFRRHPVDYCLIRIAERKWQLASKPGAESNFEPLLGRHDLEGLRVRVGGRPERLVSVTAHGAAIPTDAHERLIAWLTERL